MEKSNIKKKKKLGKKKVARWLSFAWEDVWRGEKGLGAFVLRCGGEG